MPGIVHLYCFTMLLRLQPISDAFYGAQGIEECVARVDGVAPRQEGDTYGFFWAAHGEVRFSTSIHKKLHYI